MFFVAGNLLNSLMGSGEDDDMAEEAQEDGSPIELDWSHLRTKNKKKNQSNNKKKKPVRAPSLYLHDNGGQRCWSMLSEA